MMQGKKGDYVVFVGSPKLAKQFGVTFDKRYKILGHTDILEKDFDVIIIENDDHKLMNIQTNVSYFQDAPKDR